jgi:hypothetical protein
MSPLWRLALPALVSASLLLPATASARKTKDYPNSGYCLSGKHVKDVKKCREHGGRK